jgi:hypothetical protein
VHLDTTLNVVWLLLSAFALGLTVYARSHRKSHSRNTPKRLHLAGVALILAALFPYISATDDVLRLEHLTSQHQQRSSGKGTPSDDLIRLYQTMDTPLVCRTCEIALILFFVCLVVTLQRRSYLRTAPLQAGRSPPSGLSLVSSY